MVTPAWWVQALKRYLDPYFGEFRSQGDDTEFLGHLWMQAATGRLGDITKVRAL